MASVHVLVPAQRYVFAVSNGEAEPATIASSAEGFERYKELQQGGRTTGMVAFPNTLLIRGDRDYLVDPGLIMQGAPVIGAMTELGVDPNDVKDVILTSTSTTPRGSRAGRCGAPTFTGSRPRRPTPSWSRA